VGGPDAPLPRRAPARLLLDAARESVAGALGAHPDEVSFTASGTAAAHLALLGATAGRARVGHHVVVSAVEHSAVLEAARAAERAGGSTTVVPVDRSGRVDVADFAAALRADTAVASLQHGNSEVGTVQPVAEVAACCADQRIPLHVDAAQSIGRLEPPQGWSLLTASAHKWGGPAGVGVLAVRRGVRWRAPGPDDEREHGRVPGFENVPERSPLLRHSRLSRETWQPSRPACTLSWTVSARRCGPPCPTSRSSEIRWSGSRTS
jgi:cysteine desulfurase